MWGLFLVFASKFCPVGVHGLIYVLFCFGVLDVKQFENHCSKGIMVALIWSKIAKRNSFIYYYSINSRNQVPLH